MIFTGLTDQQKRKEIEVYASKYKVKKIFVFYPDKFSLKIEGAQMVEYKEIIMYRTFYSLLEEIDDSCLLVFNECLRTQNRSELTYNCAHHYCNQTPHKLVFEYFPFIEDKDDFMILLDLLDKGRWRGKAFDYLFLKNNPVKVRPRRVKMYPVNVEITDNDTARYEKRKQSLFDNLGEKDPDTIPRELQLLAGDIKKKVLSEQELYVARNKRFKLDNVLSYTEISGRGDYTVIDTHFRRLDMNDFLKVTGMSKITYLSTILPIDHHIITSFTKWRARLEAFYAQANLYK